MIRMRSILEVADNSGARKVSCIKVVGRAGRKFASLGDIITGHVKEAIPHSNVKKGDVIKGVIVRTRAQVHRRDGSKVAFNSNAIVLVDNQRNPRGTRIFGPVARELRDKDFTKIVSLALEVV